jgi:single-strand DNA-binding protein
MNVFVGVGRLTKDVDLRYTQGGKAVGNFTIAINRPFKNDSGGNDADFINCVSWGKQAENLAQYMKKGSQIGVSGRIQTRSYDDNDGKKVYVTEIVADSVQFLESKGSNQTGSNQQQNNQQQTNQNQSNPFANDGEPIDISDSDLPF